MRALRTLERLFEIVDWLAAVALAFFGVLLVLVGVVFGYWHWGEHGTLGGYLGMLVMGVGFLFTDVPCVAAAIGMRWQAWWWWWLQVCPPVVYIIVFSVGQCLIGNSVVFGTLRFCGR